LNTRLPLRLFEAVMLLIGISLGQRHHAALPHEIGSWPLSLAGLAVSVVLCQIAVQIFLRRSPAGIGLPPFFGGIPGALSYVLILASESRADLGKVAIAQSVRLFLLVAILPSLVLAIEPAPVAAAIAPTRPRRRSPSHSLRRRDGSPVPDLARARAMLSGSLAASGLLHAPAGSRAACLVG